VSTPNQYGAWGAGEVTLPNGNRIRAGIELNAAGAAVAVHIASRHPNDFGTVGLGNVQWQRITIRNEFGWLQVIHMFDSEQADQTRGFSTMAATLHKLKMGDMQEDLELQSTHLGTKYGMYLKSPLAKHRAAEIFESEGAEGLQKAGQNLMAAQDAYYGSTGAVIDGVKIMAMFPDDEVGTVQPNQQPANHEQFKEGMMRQNAKAWGISFEEATGDFSKTSYSSARAAMQLSYLNTLTKRANFVNKIATQIFRLWFDEAIVKGYIQPPEGVDYWPSNAVESGQKFSWLTSCTWIGAGKIVIDEFKQTKANTEGMATGQFSRQDVLAEGGTDLESVADAMVAEREAYLERGLPLPEHLGGSPRGTPRVLTPAEEAALADETN
jgi:lambda family phage portal protein